MVWRKSNLGLTGDGKEISDVYTNHTDSFLKLCENPRFVGSIFRCYFMRGPFHIVLYFFFID